MFSFLAPSGISRRTRSNVQSKTDLPRKKKKKVDLIDSKQNPIVMYYITMCVPLSP